MHMPQGIIVIVMASVTLEVKVVNEVDIEERECNAEGRSGVKHFF